MEIKKFRGIKNVTSPERLVPGELTAALDMDHDDTGRLIVRPGVTNINATPLHSLYANTRIAIAVAGQNLVQVNDDDSLSTIKALTSTNFLSAVTELDTLYYSNGTDVGRIVNQTWSCWGVNGPTEQPTASQTYGELPPGNYMYAVTFVRSDGHESGTGLAGQVEVTNGGIMFAAIPVSSNPEVVSKYLYLSTPNGEVMYYAATLPNAQTVYTYSADTMDLTIPLVTQFAGPPLPGSLVRKHNGILYVVVDDTVYYSDPYNFDLFRPETNYLRFPGRVVMFEMVNDGIYIATADAGDTDTTGLTWFMKGERPDQATLVQLFDYGIIEGSAVATDAALFSKASTEAQQDVAGSMAKPLVVWTSRHGVCTGRDGGSVQNVTESSYSFPSAQRAAACVRQDEGYAVYIVSLQGPGAENNIYVETI